MKLTLNQKIAKFLSDNEEERFTARQIAEAIAKEYPEESKEKIRKSKATVNPINTNERLVEQYAAEIGSNAQELLKNNHKKLGLEQGSSIKTIEDRPRKFYLTKLSDSEEIEKVENIAENQLIDSDKRHLTEHDLYPLLTTYLGSEFGVYSKRINEAKSKNSEGKGGNKWLYPDLVGMENLIEHWHREIKDCVEKFADKKVKLWSFEIKKLINRANVRECFYQAVSNSSWANFGYLVAHEVEGVNTLKELRILSGLHGIGFIKLDAENPTESQILIQAKEKIGIDWNTANRLAQENDDFLHYIEQVNLFCKNDGKVKIRFDYKPS